MKFFAYYRKSSDDPKRQALSPAAQREAITRICELNPDIEIVEWFGESRTAKIPGRPVFNEMVTRIEAGEAEGIVAWAPNRLARNPVDAGRIIDLLDRGLLKDLKFSSYSFENNATGKFMLGILFCESSHYSNALSEIIRARSLLRVEAGWRPNGAPLGYVNHRESRTIRPHPVHFPLVRRMFEMMLSGSYRPRQIALIARDEWGFRTPRKQGSGGKPLSLGTVHRMLRNPFYAGLIEWNGRTYKGSHKPIVSIDEFEAVDSLLRRAGHPRPQRHAFAYTGMIHCASCPLMVTAEHKVNRHGTSYVYYHCSRRTLGPRCTEPSIEVRALDEQVRDFLGTLALPQALEDWVVEKLREDNEGRIAARAATARSRTAALASIERELRELTGLRTRSLIDDNEFVAERQRLQQQRVKLEGRGQDTESADRFEPFKALASFSRMALDWFSEATIDEKRLIFQTAGSNPVLGGKKLNVEAARPFVRMREMLDHLRWRSAIDDVRTPRPEYLASLRKAINEIITDPAMPYILDNLRNLERLRRLRGLSQ